MTRYAKPESLHQALDLLAQDSWRILAGGTDFYPALGAGPLKENVLDINGLTELRGITETPRHIIIGARTSWSHVIAASLPPAFDALKLAAREVGSVQIQNSGTVAGNICNASPAADGVPPLLALDAEIDIRSAGGLRRLPLCDFILGNRKTAIERREMVTAIRVPKDSAAGASSFVKLGARRYLVISIAMAAARLVLARDGIVSHAAVAVGACSAVAQRFGRLEDVIVGRPVGELRDAVAAHDFAELSPIDDVRGSAAYRRQAAREIVARALIEAADAASPEGLAA